MAKYFCLPIIIASFLIFLPQNLLADSAIVINEVFPNPSGSSSEPNEFIEFYNKGSEAVEITNWQIADAAGKSYNIPAQTLTPQGFVVFKREITKIALNNSGDQVTLTDSSGAIVDTMSYDKSIEDRSWSRVPDGTGGFENNTEPTEGAKNASAPVSPEPEKDSSTKEENQSPPKSTSTSYSTTKSPTPNPTPTAKSSSKVLGKKSEVSPILLPSKEPSPSPSPEQEEPKDTSSNIKTAGILTGSGAILIGASIAFYLWYYKVKRKNGPHSKEPETAKE